TAVKRGSRGWTDAQPSKGGQARATPASTANPKISGLITGRKRRSSRCHGEHKCWGLAGDLPKRSAIGYPPSFGILIWRNVLSQSLRASDLLQGKGKSRIIHICCRN